MFTKSSAPSIYQHQLYEPLHDIFSYLNVRDLASLARVSRRLYKYVELHYEMTCKRKCILRAVTSYLKGTPASEAELTIKETIIRGEYSYRWLYTTWKRVNRIYRKSLTNIWFPQENLTVARQSPRRVHKCERLVVHHTPLTHHQFSNVLPGTYRAAIRIKVNNMMRNMQSEPALINTIWRDSYRCYEKTTQIKWDRWRCLRDYLKQSRIVSINGAILTNFNSSTGWFDFCFEQFVIREITNVTFEFRDLENTWLKSGMRWNYLELKPIDWRIT